MLRHYVFEPSKTRKIAVLIPEKDLEPVQLQNYYALPLRRTIHRSEFIFLGLPSPPKGVKKFPAKIMHKHLANAQKIVESLGIKHVLVCSAEHFKLLTKSSKADPYYGYSKSGIWDKVNFFASVNYLQILFNPNVEYKLRLSLQALQKSLENKLGLFTHDILTQVSYPSTYTEICNELNDVLDNEILTCDFETRGLRAGDGKLKTVAFGTSETTGFAFEITAQNRDLLKQFFCQFSNTLIFHNATFDIKMAVRDLFMQNWTDTKGLLSGLDCFKKIHDTKLMAYVCLNSTAGNSLSLKDLAFEHTGDYAMEDLHDVDAIPLKELLRYNLIDAAATYYVYNLYKNQTRQESQYIYSILLDSVPTIVQTELTGLPFSPEKVVDLDHTLTTIQEDLRAQIDQHPAVLKYNQALRKKLASKANQTLKTFCKLPSAFADHTFNPGSPLQLSELLFEQLELPVLERTPTKAPATGAKVLKKLKNLATTPDHIQLLNQLVEHAEVSKIANTFIPAFQNSAVEHSGKKFLQGSFNIGGTKSGRTSSSGPNLQQIPSTGTIYAAPIKQCLQPPDGWMYISSDYNALEDRIVTIQTQDPSRLKVYRDGFDGHCLRAFSYFESDMPDIDPDDSKSVNSIAQKYPQLRQASKGPSFALQYLGTYMTLVRNFGFSEEEAKKIEAGYQSLYQVSIEWADRKAREAQKLGYMTLAYGLRLRTPVLAQSVHNGRISHRAMKEKKTAINARTQSYGLVNTRAANNFMKRVWNSEYKYDVLPVAQIHDSQYYLARKNLQLLHWLNINLIEAMTDPALLDISQDGVDFPLYLEAELDVYQGDWSKPVTIPNNLSEQQILEHLNNVCKKSS